ALLRGTDARGSARRGRRARDRRRPLAVARRGVRGAVAGRDLPAPPDRGEPQALRGGRVGGRRAEGRRGPRDSRHPPAGDHRPRRQAEGPPPRRPRLVLTAWGAPGASQTPQGRLVAPRQSRGAPRDHEARGYAAPMVAARSASVVTASTRSAGSTGLARCIW